MVGETESTDVNQIKPTFKAASITQPVSGANSSDPAPSSVPTPSPVEVLGINPKAPQIIEKKVDAFYGYLTYWKGH